MSVLYDPDLIFNPFDLNDPDLSSPLCDIDPDFNFYNNFSTKVYTHCKYHNESSLNGEIRKSNSNPSRVFSLCHFNIRSMKQSINEFECYLKTLDLKFAVIGLSETWLREENCTPFNIPGNNFVEKHRCGRKGGGVGLLINDKVSYVPRDDISLLNEYCEIIGIEIDKYVYKTSKNVFICEMYRPPNSDTIIFNEHVGSVLELLKTENKLCYSLGDYNINLLNYDSHNETRNFVDLLFSYSLIPLINRPTRITKSTATLINDVFTDNFVNMESSVQAIMVTDITDHFLIIHIDWKNEQAYSEATLVRRLYSHRNKQSFFTELTALDWNEMYMQNDTQAAFSRFHSTSWKLYDKHFPRRKITEKYNNRKPWLSEGLKQSIRNKN